VVASDPYAAKRALFTLLAANTGPAQALEGIQVSYAYPRAIEMRCIYGGGIRFDHGDQVAEGVGILVGETISVGVYVRVASRPPIAVEDNDLIAAGIGAALLGLVKSSSLAAAGTWMGVGSAGGIVGGQGSQQAGMGTYEQTDDEVISTLGFQFQFGRHISY
jgi:hypothetical protein